MVAPSNIRVESSLVSSETNDDVPWSVHRKLIDPKYFSLLLPQLRKFCVAYHTTVWGKSHPSNRISCIFTKTTEDNDNSDVSNTPQDKYYKGVIPSYDIVNKDSPKELQMVWMQLEEEFKESFDYMLVHIYRDHKDYLGWHNDKEALNTPVVSVSLGADRKFRFRVSGENKGYSHEYSMGGGDVLHMHAPDPQSINDVLRKGCQQAYQHYVPPMSVLDIKAHLIKSGITIPAGRFTKNVAERLMEKHDTYPVRINLTLRKYE